MPVVKYSLWLLCLCARPIMNTLTTKCFKSTKYMSGHREKNIDNKCPLKKTFISIMLIVTTAAISILIILILITTTTTTTTTTLTTTTTTIIIIITTTTTTIVIIIVIEICEQHRKHKWQLILVGMSSAGNNRWHTANEQVRRPALLLLQQQERAVGVHAGEGLHEGHGWLRLPRFQLCMFPVHNCDNSISYNNGSL